MHDIHKLFKPKDFALKNFHCVWYADSDKLNSILHFRKSTYSGFLKTLKIPSYYKLIKLLPGKLIRKLVFEPLSRKTEGTRNWIENNVTDKIKAFWGSREKWEEIPDDWSDFRIDRVPKASLLKHGWNEKRELSQISLFDCRAGCCLPGRGMSK